MTSAPTTVTKPAAPRRWFTKRALLAHLALLIWVPGCGVAAWWQVTIALSGNSLAYVYSVEWPVFAVFGIVGWWNLIHDDPDSVGARAFRRLSPEPHDEIKAPPRGDAAPVDKELAEYNAYLASLATKNTRKTWKKS
jgi:hypothetical protein